MDMMRQPALLLTDTSVNQLPFSVSHQLQRFADKGDRAGPVVPFTTCGHKDPQITVVLNIKWQQKQQNTNP